MTLTAVFFSHGFLLTPLKLAVQPHFFKHVLIASPTISISNSFRSSNLRFRSSAADAENNRESSKDAQPQDAHKKQPNTNSGNSFLAIMVVALGVAATITAVSVRFKGVSLGSLLGLQGSSSSSVMAATPVVGFTFKAFGYTFVLPEQAPGWVYFWLLMAAGFGLFISEEALNIWVGITLARMLSLDGTWQSFVESFSRNSPYIISTVLWVYWGVCISDMIPFYLGKFFRGSGATGDIYAKLGVGEEKVLNITRVVQKYGNLSGFVRSRGQVTETVSLQLICKGKAAYIDIPTPTSTEWGDFVERFSLGVRNPTAFLAGALGISDECFFAGVCCGGIVTLPIQLTLGFLLRERPVFALATVATVVGIWTIFPYVMAALTALFLYVKRRYST